MLDRSTEEKLVDSRIVRFGVLLDGRNTTVSMDGMLADLLKQHLGSTGAVRDWVAREVNRLAALQTTHGKSNRKAGLSRLVQRAALRAVARQELLLDAGAIRNA